MAFLLERTLHPQTNFTEMQIKQYEDKNMAHFSYAVLSRGQIALIDPSRDPQPYYDFAAKHKAKIVAVIETHPHADFISSHLEIHQTTSATIYVSKLLGAEYPHQTFDDGDSIQIGVVRLKALNTPGHSPDSISIVVTDEMGKDKAVFTGDTLFIGDCGRPDLREKAGAITATRADLAKEMYYSLRDKLMTLADDVLVYPAHGAGTLCGKALSEQSVSTMGAEKLSNWSLQAMGETEFANELLNEQPFIPKYFGFDVATNKKGAKPFEESISLVKRKKPINLYQLQQMLKPDVAIIDARQQVEFKKSHVKNAINLMNDNRFETWLGSIINPKEKFYLLAENGEVLEQLVNRVAKIGYEDQIELAIVANTGDFESPVFDVSKLRTNANEFTIIDVRNESEVKAGKIFAGSIHIPLHELRERIDEIPSGKPVVVHCAGGYRSAAASSIIKSGLNGNVLVFDLSETVKTF